MKMSNISTTNDDDELNKEDVTPVGENNNEDQEEKTDNNESGIIEFNIDSVSEFEAQGKARIKFTSPISGKIVSLNKPTTQDFLNIEELIGSKYPNAGSLKQIIINLSYLICEYGELQGDRCMSVKALSNLPDVNEIAVINMIAQKFFRLGQIRV